MKIVQAEHGWLSPTAMEQAACVMRLTPAYMVSVASFYDMFELAPKGQTDVYVCTNISCSLLGADELYAHVKDVLGGDPDFNVRAFECLGACEIAPMASVNGQSTSGRSPRTTSSGCATTSRPAARFSRTSSWPSARPPPSTGRNPSDRRTSTRSSSRTSTSPG